MKNLLFLFLLMMSIVNSTANADNGYKLWLKYDLISDTEKLNSYKELLKGYIFEGDSPTLTAAEEEFQNGLNGLMGIQIPEEKAVKSDGILIASSNKNSSLFSKINFREKLKKIGLEGYIIQTSKIDGKNAIIITANNDIGILYGIFHFLKLLQTNQDIRKLDIVSSPKVELRLLNHWDNLDGTVERGYAGFSIWDWHRLPDLIKPRYKDYARANASIGINGTVLTNVNANALVLTPYYLRRVAALADVFRPYGIKVYLTARFSAPVEIGGLETADPVDEKVKQWWNEKAKEIYTFIPDFGGFLVKANSEGQPGPQNYNRTHAEGANLLADAVAPFGGIVMWRAFVYSNEEPEDRFKQAYNEFKPLDGKFRDNVLIQVKNGPIDFQPREPVHPLFGAMPETPLMMEFQITQEYLGQATHLVYLATMYKEVLESDTYAKGEGSTVAKVIDGSLHNYSRTAMAGVSNIGTDINWTGHLFGQSNWYAYGRLAWDHQLTSEEIAEEWIRMTFNNKIEVVKPVKNIMMKSRETTVNYMTPLGLHHIMGWSHHYGPAPWIKDKHRADWTSVYYHRADKNGIGFDRTETGSNALSQYFEPVQKKYSSPETTPEEFLLWFHRLPWDYKMDSGNTLWEEICYHYYNGVEGVREFQNTWNSLKGKVDNQIFNHVKMLLDRQEKEAVWWRNACVLYFQTFSGMPIPDGLEKPDKTLEYYMNLEFPYAPGI